MGAYDADWSGEVMITPPLTWAQIQNGPKLADLEMRRDEHVANMETGQVTTVTGTHLEPRTDWGSYGGHSIPVELQQMLNAHPGHEFTGIITADGPDGDHWRYIIRGRLVIRQTPTFVWNDDEPEAEA